MRLPVSLRLVNRLSCAWVAAIAAAALVVPILAGVTGCSQRPSSADDAAANIAAIAQNMERLCDLEAEYEAGEEWLDAAKKVPEDPSGPIHLLEQSRDLEPTEQKNLIVFYQERMEKSIARMRREIEKHDRNMHDPLSPAWSKLAGEWRRVGEKQATFEHDKRKSQQSALALGTENRWFWMSALAAVAVLTGMVFLENRHDLRRWFNGGQARALGLGTLLVPAFVFLGLVTAALFFASDGILVDLLDRSDEAGAVTRMGEKANEIASELVAAEARRADQLQVVNARRKELLNVATALVPPPQSTAVFDTWWEHRQLEEKRRAQVLALQENRRRFEGVIEELRHCDAVIAADREATVGWRKYASRISGGIGLAILGLLGAGAFRFQRGVNARKRTLAATCPNCLGVGKLEPTGGPDGMLRCTNVITNTPAVIECDFQFPSYLQSRAKLSFPTLGVPTSGKTFWLSMTYDRLTSRDYPPEVNFTPVRTDQTGVIEKIVREILNDKVNPAGTQAVPPPPLCLDFSDKDRFGESSVLVNLFDYSGEVSREFTLKDHQRRRAFSADGYLWFVDPTSDKQSKRIEVTEQKNALARFESDVRQVKNLRPGQQLHRPIAICVSKIDIMINERYGKGGDIVQQFYAELGEIGWSMDVESIQARSDAMETLADTIWPNWAIKRAVNELFGGRCMFFPLSPVGLDQPGETDLRKRDISPVGILHPLMWLLHMNGYPVLPPRRASK